MLQGEGFNVDTGLTKREDSGVKRLVRGFMARRWYVNFWHVIHACGALAMAGLGAYAAIVGMIAAFSGQCFYLRKSLDLSAS